MPESSFYALLRVHLFFPDVGSLKGKRSELNRVKAALRQRLGASVAEVQYQDSWQRSVLAVALAERTVKACDEAADGIQRFLDSRFPQGVRVERRIASWTDLESIR
jgi:uncharacterized protein YlxP (DUF503 family)